MTFIDFFSGIGGMRSGLERAGHKCLGFCEFDKFARQSYKAMYDIEGEWESHDVRTVNSTDIPRADIWCFGFPCFVADTLILTDKGYVPIQNVSVGDLVLTHQGNWKPITNIMSRDNAEIWNITGFGILSTQTTNEHPYYVERDGELQFVKCEELDATKDFSTIVIPPINDNDKHTIDFWWLIGRYLADGWTVTRKDRKQGGRVVIACNNDKANVLETHITHAGYHFTKDVGVSCNKYIICNNELFNFVQEFGKYAHGKTITKTIFDLTVDKKQSVFYGYMSGDGRKDRLEATTTSASLCLGMALIAISIKLNCPAIYHTQKAKKCIIEGRECNQRDTYTFRIAKERSSKSYGRADGIVCRRINQPKRANKRATVYNISVEDDESYVANGAVVHNCQDISVAGKQKGLQEGERSGLFYEVMRLLAGLREEDKPEWLIAENVKNLLSIGNGFDFLRCLTEMGQIGYDVEWQLFNTKFGYYSYDTYIPGIPQNRERVYLIGHLGSRGGRKILPIPRTAAENNSQKSGFKIIDDQGRLTKECTPKSECPTLRSEVHGNVPKVIDDLYEGREPRVTDDAPTLRSERSGLKVAIPCLTPDRLEKRQNGRRFKEDGEEMFTLTAQDRHGVAIYDVYNHKFKNGEETGTLTAAGNSNTTAAGTMLIVENMGNNYE